jgi:hypothetical protein
MTMMTDDRGHHSHDNHGWHYGHRQSITVQSVYANNTANNTPSYVVINNNATNTSLSSSVVNWDIFAPQVGITLQPKVLTQHNTDADNLAVLTGLVVKKV